MSTILRLFITSMLAHSSSPTSNQRLIKQTHHSLLLLFIWSAMGLFSKGLAQPIADSSFRTQVSRTRQDLWLIKGGTAVDGNLFHSFKSFSIPKRHTVKFSPDQPQTIRTIFSRVSGPTPSLIYGILATEGSANLVLLNPNGIRFHDSASLDLKGSFLATTANHIQFSNDKQLSAKSLDSPALLKLSVPTGLQFGPSPRPIVVTAGSVQSSVFRDGLQVGNRQNFALAGGNLVFAEGKAIAPGGNLTLLSLGGSGRVQTQDLFDGTWSVSTKQPLGHISIKEGSRLVTRYNTKNSGENGSIALTARHINIQNSELDAENRGASKGAPIQLVASDELSLTTSSGNLDATISTQPRSRGAGGDIVLKGGRLNIAGEKTRIVTSSARFRADILDVETIGQPGNINLDFQTDINLSSGSVIAAVSWANGASGNITVRSKQLQILDGSQIRSSTEGLGNGGEVRVDVQDSILLSVILEVLRQDEQIFRPSALVTDANRENQGGTIVINTPSLRIEEGAAVQSTTALGGISGDILVHVQGLELINGGQITVNANDEEAGTAGNIDVTASDFVRLRGQRVFNADQYRSAAILAETRTQQNNAKDNGDITLTTPQLLLQEGAFISANSDSSQGGNIRLHIADLLFMESASRIESSAQSGAGGQILVDQTPWLITPSRSNSDITATSQENSGGNILLNLLGIQGFRVIQRPQTSEEILALKDNRMNDIAASSGNQGLQGTIQLNQVTPLNLQFKPLVTQLKAESQRATCGAQSRERSGQFHLIGKGGSIQHSSGESLNTIWEDTREVGRRTSVSLNLLPSQPSSNVSAFFNEEVVQAVGWQKNQNGQTVLMASGAHPDSPRLTTCYRLPS